MRFLRFYFEEYCHRSISYTQKTNEKKFFSKMRHFGTAKTVTNPEKVRTFSDSTPSDKLKKMFGASTPFQNCFFLFFFLSFFFFF